MLSALKNFGITFLIAALIFGIIAYFATGFVTNTVNSIMAEEDNELNTIIEGNDNQTPLETDTVNSDENKTGEKEPSGDSFNFLLITTDYRPDIYDDYEPTLEEMYNTDWYSIPATETTGCLNDEYRKINISSVMLVRVDKEDKQITYTYFSPLTQVYTPSGYHNLSEVYNYYGTQTVVDHINAMTGIRIDYHLLINAYNFDELSELLGNVTVNVSSNIYFDGKQYTTAEQTEIAHIGTDGNPWTEYVQNTLVVEAGEVTVDAEKLEALISVKDSSGAEILAKETYDAEIIKAYLGVIGELGEAKSKIILEKLITLKADWDKINVEGISSGESADTAGGENIGTDNTDNSSEQENVDGSGAENNDDEPYNPWTDTGGGEGSFDTELSNENTDAEKTEEPWDKFRDKWKTELAEPENPIIETNYTVDDIASKWELICAKDYFESKTVSYPGEYKAAKDDNPAYFDPDTSSGLTKFLELR